VDFNHPLVGGKRLSLLAEVREVYPKAHERGGNSADWIEILTRGPGMQSRWRQQPTEFFIPDAFERLDETPDEQFYARPKFVQHVDTAALKIVTGLYEKLLPQDGRILDLMSSWDSHLPDLGNYNHVVGLGLNADELAKNSRLDRYVVQNLNQIPRLPFKDNAFDGVICTASIEYLTDPFAVFDEVARVLVPGGVFVITFSNRWFSPKAINIWSQLHEFERMGLVMEYFLQSDKFHALKTFSQRGLPRDKKDKYYGQLFFADPVYAVWGQRTQ
jgi:SAM-dependent methyltransferase